MAPARACLCVLCGLPAAGKSRLARELRGHAHTMGWRTLLVTYDELIPARDWRETEWKQHRKAVLMCLERFLHQTHTLSDQTHTLSDQTHTLSDQTHTHTLSDQTHTLSDQTHTHTLSDQIHTLSDQTHTHTLSDQIHTHSDETHTLSDQTHTLSDQTQTHTLSDQTHTLSDQTHTLSEQTHTLSDQTHTLSDKTHTLSDQTHTLSDQTHTLSDQTHTHTLSDQTHTLSDQTHTHTLSDQTHTLSESDDGVWMRFQQMLQQQSGSHTHTHSDQTHTHTHSDQTHTHTHSRPLVLLLDDNFYYQSMRHQIHQLARKYAVGFCQVFLSCPLQVCVQRNRRRAQCVCVPEPVLLQVCERMEAPEPDRNQWEQRSLTLDTSDHTTTADLQRLVELLASALENPLKPVQDESQQKEADRRICASSALHQADQTCRRLVSQAVASAREAQASPLQLRALVCELSELKALVLRDLRSGPGALEQQLLGFERRTRQALARHTRPLTPDL